MFGAPKGAARTGPRMPEVYDGNSWRQMCEGSRLNGGPGCSHELAADELTALGQEMGLYDIYEEDDNGDDDEV